MKLSDIEWDRHRIAKIQLKDGYLSVWNDSLFGKGYDIYYYDFRNAGCPPNMFNACYNRLDALSAQSIILMYLEQHGEP